MAVILGRLGQLWWTVIPIAIAAAGSILSETMGWLGERPPVILARPLRCYEGTIDWTVPLRVKHDPRLHGTDFDVYLPPDHPRTGPGKPEGHSQEFAYSWDPDVTKGESELWPRREWATISVDGRRYLNLKFGTAQFHVKRGRAKDCAATATVTLLKGSGESEFVIGQPYPLSLNWWDAEKWSRLNRNRQTKAEIFEHPDRGIGEYIQNPMTTIPPKGFGEIPLFYMRERYPVVFFNGPPRPLRLGVPGDGDPVEFDIEVSLVADGIEEPQKFKYHASARWDHFTLEQTQGHAFISVRSTSRRAMLADALRTYRGMTREEKRRVIKGWDWKRIRQIGVQSYLDESRK